MSGLELVGFILGVLGPIEQTINIANLLRNHVKFYQENEKSVGRLIESMEQLRHDLKQLNIQFTENQSSIPQANRQMVITQLNLIKDKFKQIDTSLRKMERSAGCSFKRFRKASKWACECDEMQDELKESLNILLQINSFLGSNAAITFGTQQINNNINRIEDNIMQAFEAGATAASSSLSTDAFYPSWQRLHVSGATVLDFDSTDSDDKPLTVEGKIKLELLDVNEVHRKVFSIQGQSGVGKTTVLHMLSHNQQLREYFIDGVYYIKLGADADIETAINQLAEVVRRSGGIQKSAEIRTNPNMDEAIISTSKWLQDRCFLLLVDDIWEQRGLGNSFISSLEQIVTNGIDARIVFTTRDPAIAFRGRVFRVKPREPRGNESRRILLRHAQQEEKTKLNKATENAITQLLDACAGFPVAHSVAGRGVLQYSMRGTTTKENAWIMYFSKQESILNGTADGYGCPWSIFETSLDILDMDLSFYTNSDELNEGYSYREMHRALCVLEKQQPAPLEMLGHLWNIQREEVVRNVCQDFVRVGLAEWHAEGQGEVSCVERLSIHDLLHKFAAEKGEAKLWHTRLVESYAFRNELKNISSHGCREWWTIVAICTEKDGGYLSKNLCQHLRHSMQERNEALSLVSRPQWISKQLTTNGILYYERDISIAYQSIQEPGNTENPDLSIERLITTEEMGVRELMMIRDAARLAVSYINRDPKEIWFQMYARLLKVRYFSGVMMRYLTYLETTAPRPWMKPINIVDGLITSVGTRVGTLVNIGTSLTCMVLLPDAKVICGCKNGELVVLSVKESVIQYRWTAHNNSVRDLVISGNGEFVVSVSNDDTGKVWQVENWSEVGMFEGHSNGFGAVKFSPDEKHLYTISKDGKIRTWDVERGCRLCKKITGFERPWVMAVLGDGKRIVTGSHDNNILVWEAEMDSCSEPVSELELYPPSTFQTPIKIPCEGTLADDFVSCIQLSESGSTMATGHENGSIKIWNSNEMSSIGRPWNGHDGRISSMSFSRDDTQIASGSSDGTIEVRNVTTGELIFDPFHGHTGEISGVIFIERESNIVSCSTDGTVRTWKMNKSVVEESITDHPRTGIKCMTISPDESHCVTTDVNGSFAVWDIASGQLLRKSSFRSEHMSKIAVTANGQWIIAIEDQISIGSDVINVIDFHSLVQIASFKGKKNQMRGLDITRKFDYMITGVHSTRIRLWDFREWGGCYDIIETDSPILRAFVSADGKRIIATSYDGFIRVWEINTKQCVKQFACPDSDWLLKEEILLRVEEGDVEQLFSQEKLFCRTNTTQIRYGATLKSVLLATVESSVENIEYSSRHETGCVKTTSGKLAFFKVER